ncbi:MAG: hypothetical protein AABZ06_04655, partial [Bdellovibrionota bacterium]
MKICLGILPSTLIAQKGLLDFLIAQQILTGIFQYNSTNAENVTPVCNLKCCYLSLAFSVGEMSDFQRISVFGGLSDRD